MNVSNYTKTVGLKIQVFFNDVKSYVVLPDRFIESINQEQQIQELKSAGYWMKYSGKDKSHYNFIQVEFLKPTGKIIHSFIFNFFNK